MTIEIACRAFFSAAEAPPALLSIERALRPLATERLPSAVLDALALVRVNLLAAGWTVADGSRSTHGIEMGPSNPSGTLVRCDAYHEHSRAAMWLELGRGWINNEFLKHVVEGALAPELGWTVILLPHRYKGSVAYERAEAFLEAWERSERWPPPCSVALVRIGAVPD